MDGIAFFQNEASPLSDGVGPAHAIRTAVLLTVVSVALTLGVLAGLRGAGAAPPVASEIATAPVAW